MIGTAVIIDLLDDLFLELLVFALLAGRLLLLASIAGLLITTEAMVAEWPKKDSGPPAMPGGGMGGMDY